MSSSQSYITCLMDSTKSSRLHLPIPLIAATQHYIADCVCVCMRECVFGVCGALCQIYGPADSPHLREK